MQEYAEPASAAFAQSRAYYGELEEWLSGEEACLRHADLEEQLQERGRKLLRRLHQGHLDLLAAREDRRDGVRGPDGIARTRAEKGHHRPLATVFGQVTVSRMPYRAPGSANVHPLDEALNLPEEKSATGCGSSRRSSRPRLVRGGGRRDHPRDRGKDRETAGGAAGTAGCRRRGRVLR